MGERGVKCGKEKYRNYKYHLEDIDNELRNRYVRGESRAETWYLTCYFFKTWKKTCHVYRFRSTRIERKGLKK